MNNRFWTVLAIAAITLVALFMALPSGESDAGSQVSGSISNSKEQVGYYTLICGSGSAVVEFVNLGQDQIVDRVDWGDGETSEALVIGDDGLSVSHRYAGPGYYYVTIDGHASGSQSPDDVWLTIVVPAHIKNESDGDWHGSSAKPLERLEASVDDMDNEIYYVQVGAYIEISNGSSAEIYGSVDHPWTFPITLSNGVLSGYALDSGTIDAAVKGSHDGPTKFVITIQFVEVPTPSAGSGTSADPYVFTLETGNFYCIGIDAVGTFTKYYGLSGDVSIPGMSFTTSFKDVGTVTTVPKDGLYTGQLSDLMVSGTPTTGGTWDILASNPSSEAYYRIIVTGEDVSTQVGISSVSGLRGMSMDGDYVLTSDITISGSWTPIGTESAPFNGTLDGNGHTITITSTVATALFGYIGGDGIVKDLSVDISVIVSDSPADVVTRDNRGFTHGYSAAGIVLDNAGTIRQCGVSGTIIVTSSPTGSLSGSYSAEWGPDVTVNIRVGGIAANNSGFISNCYSAAQVSATAQIHLTSTITNTIAFGTADVLAAGIVADNSGSVSNCYSVGSVSESVSITSGGKVGAVNDTDDAVAGGIAATSTGAVSGCYYLSGSVSGTASSLGTSRTSSQLQSQSTFIGWDFTEVWIMDGFPQLQSLAGSVAFTSSTAASTVALGQDFSYTPTTSPSGATLSIVSDDTGCLTISGGVLKGTIAGIPPGTYHVVIKASYGSMTPATQTITVNVPVSIIDPADYSVYTNTQWTYDPETDPESAEITLVSVKRNGSTVSNHGIVVSGGVISGTFSETGTWTITIQASYTTYEPTNKTVTVIVSEAPVVVDPPTLSGIIASPHYEQDRMYYFVAVGAGGYVTASWDFGDGSSSVTGTLSAVHRFTQSGLYNVTLTLANSEGETVSRTVTVLITDETSRNDAWIGVLYSTMVPIPSGSTPLLDGPDWLSVVSETYGGQLYAIVSGTPGDTSLAGTTAEIRLTAGTVDESWTIEIHERKTTKPTATFEVDVDNGLTVILEYTGQAASRIFIDWGEGAGMERQASVTGPFEHTYASAGLYTVKIEVANNNGSLTSSKQINVREKVIEVSMGDIPDQKVAVGQELRIEVVTEPADAVLSLSGADWLEVDGHIVVGTPPEGTEPRAYTIILTAMYDGGKPETATFVVTVVETGGEDPEPTPEPDTGSDGEPQWTVFAAVCVIALLLGIASRNPYVILICAAGVVIAAYLTGVIG